MRHNEESTGVMVTNRSEWVAVVTQTYTAWKGTPESEVIKTWGEPKSYPCVVTGSKPTRPLYDEFEFHFVYLGKRIKPYLRKEYE